MPVLKNLAHEIFCRDYVLLQNGTQAAINAGYSEKTAAQSASRLLKTVKVAERIAELTEIQAQSLDVTEDKVMQHLASIAFGNVDDFVHITSDGEPRLDFSKATPMQRAAIKKMRVDDYLDGRGEDARDVRKVEFEFHPKLPALIKLGEKMGYFRDPAKAQDDAAATFREAMAQVFSTNTKFPIATEQARKAAMDEEDEDA